MASSHERVVRIINTTTGAKLVPSDVSISNVRVNTNPDIDRNTACQLTATSEGRLTGAGPYFYNRLDLGKMFFGQRPTVDMPTGSRITTQELAAMLRDKYSVDIQPEDIEASTSYYVNSFPFDLELVATEGSYCVTGKVTARIIETGAPIDEAMGVRTLSGINAPNGDLSKWQGVLYSWGWAAPLQLYMLIEAAYAGDGYLTAEAAPYIAQLSGHDWVFDADNPAQFNLAGARVVYRGSRDDHPDYASSSYPDEIAVIRLGDLCQQVGGDLVIIL